MKKNKILMILALTLVLAFSLGNSDCQPENTNQSQKHRLENPSGQNSNQNSADELSRDEFDPFRRSPETDSKIESESEPNSVSDETARMTILVDKTQSGAETLLKNEREKLRKVFLSMALKEVSVCNFGTNGKSAWHAGCKDFPFPNKPMIGDFDEAKAREEAEKICRGRIECIEKGVNNRKKTFDTDNEDVKSKYKKDLLVQIDKVLNEILAESDIEPVCTDFNEIGDRIISTSSDLVILISDGKHDCSTTVAVKDFSSKRKVLFLMMPLDNEQPGNGFQKRMDFMQSVFQNAKILPIVSSDSETISKDLKTNTY